MKKIIDVVGARPQFIKVSAICRAMKKAKCQYIIVNTDQHYDEKMSKVFFSELKISPPHYSLGIGSGSHADQTGKMLIALEKIFQNERPDIVQVYGDTNSTIAAALAAAKLNIKISHVEAGLRSFNRAMPEEINRIVTDHLSNFLFAPTKTAMKHLKSEGLSKKTVWTGDVMLDVVENWKKYSNPTARLFKDPYALVTIHRAENTDQPKVLKNIIEGLKKSKTLILLPLHPRLKKMLAEFHIELPKNIFHCAPLSHSEMLSAIHHADCIVTDSGGLQKEAFYMNRPCVTIREETEWVELLQAGVNVLSGTSSQKIAQYIQKGMRKKIVSNKKLFIEYGEGKAAQRIVKALL